MRLMGIAVILLAPTFGICRQTGPPQPRAATLAQQKMCGEQARKKFREDNPKPNDFTGYTSHFDAAANVCYIMVHSVVTEKGVPSVSDVVYDAFEGRVYASYVWINSQGKKYWEVAPMECRVKPRGQAEITCKSSKQFDDLVEKNFGVGR